MTAPKLGPLRGHVHRFELGAFEVTTVLDGAIAMGVSPPFLVGEDEARIADIAREALLPPDRLENNFVPALVNTGEALVLFDTGCGHFRRDRGAGHLRERLAEAGHAPGDVDVVALTHAHPDHIGGLWEDGALAFPNARHVIGRREHEAWSSGDGIPPQRAENRAMYLDLVTPLEDRLTFLDDGDEVVPGIRAEAAFGHSAGHLMFRLLSEGAEALLWGDVANHFVFSVEHPRAQVGFDDDKAAGIATRERVLEEVAGRGTLIVGHHMPFPGVGHVRREGGRHRWVPISYQLRV